MPARLHQSVGNAPGPPAADDLRGAFLVGAAGDRAIGARLAGAIGAAAVERRALRELAAGLVAGALECIGGGLGQRHVARERRRAGHEGAGQDKENGKMSHGSLHAARRPPGDDSAGWWGVNTTLGYGDILPVEYWRALGPSRR